MQKAPNAILSRAKVMETQNRKLLEDMERIVNKVRRVFVVTYFLLHDKGPILLLLLSNLLLWGNVASEPKCHIVDGRCEVFLEELFEHAIHKSKVIQDMSSGMYNQFATKFVKRDNLIVQAFSTCHTTSLRAPRNKGQANRVQPLILLKLTLSLVSSWNWPLNYLLIKLPGMQGSPAALLAMVKEIKENKEELLDDIHRLLKKVYPEVQANEDYPVWSEVASLQALEEKSPFLALFKLVHCLRLETYKTMVYIKVLKCQIIYNNNCPRDSS
uniref:prolactin-like n=1 Tax=Jaculus jaculus TaxID=51337 RepID=UPI001E1B0104|nr:prolactin-like [Jaculus jaculus]